jgi:hypothetical protein
MPHMGQAAGLSEATPGHMGQMYLALDGAGGGGLPAECAQQQWGQWLSAAFSSSAGSGG